MTWAEAQVEEFAEVKGGKRLPKGHDFASEPTPYPYIRARDIGDGKITFEEPVYLPEETRRALSRYTVQKDDVVITIVGANVGDVGYIPEEFDGANLTENAAKLVVNREVIDPYFLKSYLATERSKKELAFIASGAAQGKLGLYKIKSFKVPLPPLAVQLRISDILSPYDNLIENNRRRIALLEEASRQLYKEWFVRFRFPGHEHTKIIDGIPEGWETKTLGDALTLQRGFDLPTKNRVDGKIPIYASTGINGYHNEAKVKGPGVVTGRSGSLGQVQYVHEDFWPLNTALWVKEFKRVDPFFAYFLLSSLKLETYNGGAAVPTLNRNDAHRIEISLPPGALMDQFTEQADIIFQQTKKLDQMNTALSQARDLLLPKLMSGEVPV